MRGTNNVLRIFCPANADSARLTVWFDPPLLWRLAQGASLAGLVLLLAALARRGRRRA